MLLSRADGVFIFSTLPARFCMSNLIDSSVLYEVFRFSFFIFILRGGALSANKSLGTRKIQINEYKLP